MEKIITLSVLMLFFVGCGVRQQTSENQNGDEKLKTVFFHIAGFTKSKSGAIWMTWPEKVKQALDGLAAVKKVEMHLERDEFEVTFDASQIDEQKIIETIDKTGFKATLVASRANVKTSGETSENDFVLPPGFKILDDALAQARKENKPLLIDFYAEWCAACQRMEKETFADPKVKERLQKVIVLKVDTDKEPALSEKFGVVGLPDFRLMTNEGREFRRLRGFQTAEKFKKGLEELSQITKK